MSEEREKVEKELAERLGFSVDELGYARTLIDHISIYEHAALNALWQALVDQGMEQRWIPVSERLPDNDGIVIIAHLFKGEGVLSRDANGVHTWFARFDGERWLRGDGFLSPEDFHANVTHWRPLPAPPKEGER